MMKVLKQTAVCKKNTPVISATVLACVRTRAAQCLESDTQFELISELSISLSH